MARGETGDEITLWRKYTIRAGRHIHAHNAVSHFTKASSMVGCSGFVEIHQTYSLTQGWIELEVRGLVRSHPSVTVLRKFKNSILCKLHMREANC